MKNSRKSAFILVALPSLLTWATQTHAEGPLIMGYYPNWARYSGGGNFLPQMIPDGVQEVVYAFAQFGSCFRKVDAQHPDGYATEADPTYCIASPFDPKLGYNPYCMAGTQDYKLSTTDAGADYTWIQGQDYPMSTPRGMSCGWGSGITDALNRAAVIKARAVVSIGGWSLSAPIRQAILPANQGVAIQSIVDWLIKAQTGADKKWDGVDIDWEPNGNQWTLKAASPLNRTVTKTDLINYLSFLTSLRTRLCQEKNKGTISGCEVRIAMTANPQAIVAANKTYGGPYWKKVADSIDSINMMTYDYKGPFGQAYATCTSPYTPNDNCTGFNGPLLIDNSTPKAYDSAWSIQGSLKALQPYPFPREKVGIGIANYGRAFALPSMPTPSSESPYLAFQSPNGYSAGSCSILNPPDDIPAPFDGYNGEITNRTLIRGINQYGRKTGYNFWPKYRYYGNAGEFYSVADKEGASPPCLTTFDLAATAAQKMKYAIKNGLAGIIIWDLSQDVRPGDIDQQTGKPVDMAKKSTLYGLINYKKF